jgi:hypothetical protein
MRGPPRHHEDTDHRHVRLVGVCLAQAAPRDDQAQRDVLRVVPQRAVEADAELGGGGVGGGRVEERSVRRSGEKGCSRGLHLAYSSNAMLHQSRPETMHRMSEDACTCVCACVLQASPTSLSSFLASSSSPPLCSSSKFCGPVVPVMSSSGGRAPILYFVRTCMVDSSTSIKSASP